jgi:hypothetical protein
MVVIEHEHEHPVDEPHPSHDARRLVDVGGSPAAPTGPPRHAHRHQHIVPVPEDPFRAPGRSLAFGIGMLHGVGAETPTQVLLFVTAAGAVGPGAGVGLLVCFLAGLLVSNTGVAAATTFGFNAASNFTLYAAVSVTIALSSFAIGTALIAGWQLPAIFAS